MGAQPNASKWRRTFRLSQPSNGVRKLLAGAACRACAFESRLAKRSYDRRHSFGKKIEFRCHSIPHGLQKVAIDKCRQYAKIRQGCCRPRGLGVLMLLRQMRALAILSLVAYLPLMLPLVTLTCPPSPSTALAGQPAKQRSKKCCCTSQPKEDATCTAFANTKNPLAPTGKCPCPCCPNKDGWCASCLCPFCASCIVSSFALPVQPEPATFAAPPLDPAVPCSLHFEMLRPPRI